MGQQAHKHGTGRCYALHPTLSAAADARGGPFPFKTFTFYFSDFLIIHFIFLMLCVWLARRSRGSVVALFSLFEKAMLSASQNDITLRASHWSNRTKRPYLKTQSPWLFLLEQQGNLLHNSYFH